MWKYIVTYWVVIFTPVLKKADSPVMFLVDGVVIPKDVMYIELIKDTLCVKDTFVKRQEAIDYIDARETSKFFKEAYEESGYKTWFKLDSIPLKQYDCDPPQPNCNKRTCLKCGKQWPSY